MRRTCWLVAMGLVMAVRSASAGLIAPGETATINAVGYVPPAGLLLAEKQVPFAINYGVSSPSTGFDGTLQGQLTSSVYKTDNVLWFLYSVDLSPVGISGAAEQSVLSVGSFAGYATRVSGAVGFEEMGMASRSSNGSTVRFFGDTPGLGGAPTLLIETDATAFDARGTALFTVGDEISMLNGQSIMASGDASIEGVYQPVTARPPASAIPLPPAAYSGLGVLLGMGILAATRRVWAYGTVRG